MRRRLTLFWPRGGRSAGVMVTRRADRLGQFKTSLGPATVPRVDALRPAFVWIQVRQSSATVGSGKGRAPQSC